MSPKQRTPSSQTQTASTRHKAFPQRRDVPGKVGRSPCEARATAKVEGDFLRAMNYVVSQRLRQPSYAWEHQITLRLQSIEEYEAVVELLEDGDVNTRIFLIEDIIGRCGPQLSDGELMEMRQRLRTITGDGGMQMQEIPYGGLQCEDDEAPRTVAWAAKNALAALDAAWHDRVHGSGNGHAEQGK